MVPDIKWSEIKHWWNTRQQPSSYLVAAWLTLFVDHDSKLPVSLAQFDWTKSFDKPIVIGYDERVTIDTLRSLQGFFREQPCDITNITVILTYTAGAKDWWERYQNLCLERTFNILEWNCCRSLSWPGFCHELQLLDVPTIMTAKKNLKHLFSFYGGSNSKIDRLYLTLKMRDLHEIGLVDCLCDRWGPCDEFVNHAMYLGYFMDEQEERDIEALYHRYVSNQKLQLSSELDLFKHKVKVRAEQFHYQGFQFAMDSCCLATVINETDNFSPWIMISEKTVRAFLHHNIVIPNSYRAVEILEDQGFWFPHNVIDYSYQYEKDRLRRWRLMIESIKSTDVLIGSNYWNFFTENFANIRSNAQKIYDWYWSDSG